MIRWGVIGCGEATEKKSGPAFQRVEGSTIEAVMSRNAERARSYAERHGMAAPVLPSNSRGGCAKRICTLITLPTRGNSSSTLRK